MVEEVKGRKREYDVIGLGELLIDFTEAGMSEQGNRMLEVCPGGAPCNMMSLLSRMGKRTAFIGKVGKDQFGSLLRETLRAVGIDDKYLLEDPVVGTTLAFVHTQPDGDREFSFYRNPGADMMLAPSEIDVEATGQCKIFHFGTLSMTHEGVREATKKAVKAAKERGALISFDPNLREPLWDDLENAREQMLYGMSVCDILKISDNEIQFVSGLEDYDRGIEWVKSRYDIPLICLTMGKDGSRAYYKEMRVEVPGVKCETVETTGAGDTFCGSVLNYLLENGVGEAGDAGEDKISLPDLTEEGLEKCLRFANAAAAFVTTRKGAIKSMPKRAQVEEMLKQYL